jgi:hypothetical protein
MAFVITLLIFIFFLLPEVVPNVHQQTSLADKIPVDYSHNTVPARLFRCSSQQKKVALFLGDLIRIILLFLLSHKNEIRVSPIANVEMC